MISSNTYVNRRTPGNASISDLQTLQVVIEIARKKGAKVFLTLNQPSYRAELYPKLLELAQEAQKLGIDGLIIGDPSLIISVKDTLPQAIIHVSSLAAVLNSASVKFFRDLGASRIIFPRYISVSDIAKIIANAGSAVEYEVFIMNDGCIFEESYCFANHAFGGNFCNIPNWFYRLRATDSLAEPQIDEPFQEHLTDYKKWVFYGISGCDGGTGPGGFPLGMCGLCAIPDLYQAGISSIKIVGREAPLHKKAASVKTVKYVLDLAKSGAAKEVIQARAKRMKGTPGICSGKYSCYYR